MPNDDESPTPLSALAVKSILAEYTHDDAAALGRLAEWLSNVLLRAVRRARSGKPLTAIDVAKLEAAYDRFRFVIAELQDRDEPPPQLPVSEGADAWEKWLIIGHHYPPKQGRRESSDWRLMAQLLALYEIVSAKKPSAAQAGGPTMRFLDRAMRELASHAPADVRSNFRTPKVEALRKKLSDVSAENFYHDLARKELSEILR